MAEVTMRELRSHTDAVIDRVENGERLTITRSGRPVAELRPLPRPSVSRVELISSWRSVPTLDPDHLRADSDRAIDPTL
jgi:prevent-host-death family protein